MTVGNPDPDEELVARAGRGEGGAVRTLVERKASRILALAARVLGDIGDAEDVVQETFVKAWRFAPHWRAGEARFDTWLHKVALNLCYDRLRRRPPTTSDLPDLPDPGPAPDRNLHARDVGQRVEAALRLLAPRQREAIVLCHYQELTNIDAADVMEVSVEALESLLSRARRALRNSLADLVGDD